MYASYLTSISLVIPAYLVIPLPIFQHSLITQTKSIRNNSVFASEYPNTPRKMIWAKLELVLASLAVAHALAAYDNDPEDLAYRSVDNHNDLAYRSVSDDHNDLTLLPRDYDPEQINLGIRTPVYRNWLTRRAIIPCTSCGNWFSPREREKQCGTCGDAARAPKAPKAPKVPKVPRPMGRTGPLTPDEKKRAAATRKEGACPKHRRAKKPVYTTSLLIPKNMLTNLVYTRRKMWGLISFRTQIVAPSLCQLFLVEWNSYWMWN